MAAPKPTFFDDHAVSLKVADARPYTFYEQGDPKRLVREAWSQSPRFAAKIARQSSGLIIHRYAPTTLGLPQVPAELRPDSAVETNSHWHYHGDDPGLGSSRSDHRETAA